MLSVKVVLMYRLVLDEWVNRGARIQLTLH